MSGIKLDPPPKRFASLNMNASYAPPPGRGGAKAGIDAGRMTCLAPRLCGTVACSMGEQRWLRGRTGLWTCEAWKEGDRDEVGNFLPVMHAASVDPFASNCT
eukprot:3882870-Pleurochrysis_carterae.AAC.2